MFIISHNGDGIGTSQLESGDPAEHSVSGVFSNLGGAKALAGFIKSVDGKEEDGAVFVELNSDFVLMDKDKNVINYKEGTLIAVPAEDETFIEFSGFSEEDYKLHFAGHIAALEGE